MDGREVEKERESSRTTGGEAVSRNVERSRHFKSRDAEYVHDEGTYVVTLRDGDEGLVDVRVVKAKSLKDKILRVVTGGV